jgi:glycosyltransferase involved in cell wall biosynthesis
MQKQSTPLVSIIITTYNRASLVVKAVDSVLQQTFTDYELIVVDDASTDNTATLLQSRYGNAIVYIRQARNGGISAARNAGIAVSRGVYIAFLDDDDEWLPEKLALQTERLQADVALGMISCWSYVTDEHDAIIGQLQPDKAAATFNAILCRNIDAPPSAALIKKTVFTATGVFDIGLSGCADWDLWIRIAQESTIDVIPVPLVKYRIHGQNMHSKIAVMEQDTFAILRKYQPQINAELCGQLFFDKSIYFAWQYYDAGNKNDFSRLLIQAMQVAPGRNNIFNYEGDIAVKERDFFAVLDSFWNSRESANRGSLESQAYARQFRQLAWAYYHRGDLADFRRCAQKVFYYSRPRIPLRLLVAYVKSLLGRAVAEKIHGLRKRIFSE